MSLNNVSKAFDTDVLCDFSIDFEEGKTTVLLGPSGSGKTTIANIILGIIKPDKGSVFVDKNFRPSVVFQEDRIIDGISVLNNLKAVCSDEYLCMEALKKMCLSDSFLKYPYELSGGMKRRVALARAIVYNGNSYIMDEPFKGIDILLKKKLISEMKNILSNKTSIIITHEIDEAVELGNNIVILGKSPLKVLEIINNTGKKEVVNYIKKFIINNTESDF